MPRGVKRDIVYTGQAAKAHEKVVRLEAELKAAREELKKAVKKQEQEEKAAKAKEEKEFQSKVLKAIKESGKTPEEILAFLEKKQGDIVE